MEFTTFIADDVPDERGRRRTANFRRAGDLMLTVIRNQKGKPSEKDCTSLIEDVLYGDAGKYRGKTFVEARQPGNVLCGMAIHHKVSDALYVDLLCSDCPRTGTLLIGEISRQATAAGKSLLRLFAVKDAIGFYTKLGFTPTGPMYDAGQDMELRIAAPAEGPAAAGASGGRRKTYRRRKSRKHGSTSIRRHKARRLSSR